VPSSRPSRLAYIDWLRGLACVLMFQTHCYDAWLGGAARDSRFAMWSQLGGTFPAPLFLFLAGISVALIAEKMLQKGSTASQVGKKIIFRGTEILGLGLLFRVQEYAISWGWAPWTDLFRVDILNTIGVSILLMGAVCWIALLFTRLPRVQGVQAQKNGDQPGLDVRRHMFLAAVASIMAVVISSLTPLLWTTWRPRFLPWQLESYINGVHNLGTPQAWLFPIFPWTGFAFAGLSMGSILASGFSQKLGSRIFLLTGASGVALVFAAKWSDSLSGQIYPVYDYWHTSPSFFLLRIGMLLVLVLGAFVWCRWGLGQIGFSPLIQLGKTSLLVYWVHIELVYGRFHILAPRSQTILGASKGLLTIFLAMLGLSLARTAWKARIPSPFGGRKPAQAAG
jgi:uncharacterized membrane protein